MNIPGEHHPDIQAALGALTVTSQSTSARQAVIERTATALKVLLRASYSSRSLAAWNFSPLTGDGFPLELAFTTADFGVRDSRLRYTVDPGGPDLPTTERLRHAVALLAELGSPAPNAALLELLARWQRAAPPGALHYGAWVGGWHAVSCPNKAPMDHFKLYVEIPLVNQQIYQDLICAHLYPSPLLPGRELALRMLAIEPTNGRMEFYFRVRHLQTLALGHLLHPAGLRQRRDELLEFIQQAYGHSLDERIPGGSVGFSYAVTPGEPTAFTLFLFIRLLWSGDGRIRRRFCEYLQSAGLDPAPYSHVTAPLAERDIYQTYHGLLGFTFAAMAPIQLSLGVRPPPLLSRTAL